MRTFIHAGVGVIALAAAMQPAMAADLPVKARPAPVVAAVYGWEGFYIGGNFGYSWGRARTDLDGTLRQQVFRTAGPDLVFDSGPLAASFGQSSANVDGWIGGGQIGFNWQRDRWVYGIEADIQASGEKGSSSASFTTPIVNFQGIVPGQVLTLTADHKLRWFGTLRPRIGMVQDRVLFYVTGGLAYGELESNFTATSSLPGTTATIVSSRNTRFGWTVGAGAEAALWDRWSAKLEYLYMDLGRFGGSGVSASTNQLNTPLVGFNTVTTFTGTASTRFTDHIFRVGLNYRFGPAAVTARY